MQASQVNVVRRRRKGPTTRKIARWAVLLMLLAHMSLIPARARPGSSAAFAQIDAYVQSQMENGSIPGLSLAIIHGNQVVHLQGFGVADPSGRLVTPQTPFIIGSISKTFTALAIHQLVNAGKLDLDMPIQHVIPWFRVADPDASAQITIRHLLDHRSGIPRMAGQQAYLLDDRYSLEELVRKMATIKLNAAPGTHEEYSNLNFLILGLVVKHASGQSFGAYVQQHIFTPLEMRHSYISESDAQQDGLASGYRAWFGFQTPTHLPYLRAQISEGYLISTAEDMGHFMIPYMNDGAYAGKSVLALGRAPSSLGNAWYDQYWTVHPEPSTNIRVGQSGGTPNYSGQLWLLPEHKWGVVVLMNAQPDTILPVISASTIATGVALMLQDIAPGTPGGLNFLQWYLLIDALLLALVAFIVWRALRLRHWRQAFAQGGLPRRAVSSITVDAGLGFGMLLGVPMVAGRSWSYWLLVLPDITGVLLGAVLTLIAIGLIEAGMFIAFKRGQPLVQNRVAHSAR